MEIEFEHHQSAHCESGVTSNLLRHHGCPVSESLAFGIGSGLFFCYLPFMKINNLPLTSFRFLAGAIFKRVGSRLGFCFESRRFRNPERAMAELDAVLDRGFPVGLQVGVYWLPYFPDALRFHFNAHNLVVYGKTGNDYLISDPVLDSPVTCSSEDLRRVRFAWGPLAPRGRMFHIERPPERVALEKPVRKGLKETINKMLGIPLPLFGVRGIRFLAGRMKVWPNKLGEKKAAQYLGQVIRMQEEIGTGGAGFRFIYSAFLQEAAEILDLPSLQERSKEMTAAGDRWQAFALTGARICKGRAKPDETYASLYEILNDCADLEEQLFQNLRKSLKNGAH